MGQGTECTDRPTEVSVIRFVSRNRTIEEIAPKKEIFTCKQQGCGKIFTNQDEFRTHEALEELKIRFICREPGCGKEMPDPGTMWRHYQECHNNEAHAFVCPYTSCNNSLHSTSENLAEHIQNSHRQPPVLPSEPEIICFEGPTSETVEDDEDASRTVVEDDEDEQDDQEEIILQHEDDDKTDHEKEPNRFTNNSTSIQTIKNTHVILNKNLSINHEIYKNKEERLIKTSICDKNITINTKNIDNTFYRNNIYEENTGLKKTDDPDNDDEKLQDHRIDLGNLESVFRSGLEGDVKKIEVNNETVGNNCSDDEEYTPKKQRMSRFKKEEQPYKCDINGCGKTYKYISHYRHHQDSHKIQDNNTVDKQLPKSPPRSRSKASAVNFYLCKIPGCGAQVNNVTSLWKHYQENHANSKTTISQSTKSNQTFR